MRWIVVEHGQELVSLFVLLPLESSPKAALKVPLKTEDIKQTNRIAKNKLEEAFFFIFLSLVMLAHRRRKYKISFIIENIPLRDFLLNYLETSPNYN